MIDVIIPVFRGFAATRRAVESALSARSDEPHRVVVIDDASPEPAISRWLEAMASEGRFHLVRHDANRGFVASVNEGMGLAGDRDVVLLNSDTEVPDHWLDRIARCARSGDRIACVTPFSNNATICSYPRFVQANALGRDVTPAGLDRLFAAENAGASVEIPTAVGFCMFISRQALDELGAFDEQAFGAGYGEEVDFCMRAARAGYRHLLCGDTFVFHQGEVSFGNTGSDRRARAQALVDERYPEFQVEVRKFIAADPPRPYRRRVDIARLRVSRLPRWLLVVPQGRPDIEHQVATQARMSATNREAILLRVGSERIEIQWLREGEEFEAGFDARSGWTQCLELLRRLRIDEVHLHQAGSLPEAVACLPASLGADAVLTVHAA